ncbi:hypothetical protein [Lacticaseibacillus suihuaensis]
MRRQHVMMIARKAALAALLAICLVACARPQASGSLNHRLLDRNGHTVGHKQAADCGSGKLTAFNGQAVRPGQAATVAAARARVQVTLRDFPLHAVAYVVVDNRIVAIDEVTAAEHTIALKMTKAAQTPGRHRLRVMTFAHDDDRQAVTRAHSLWYRVLTE